MSAINVSTTSIDTKIPSQGQAIMASSLPVVLSSDHSNINTSLRDISMNLQTTPLSLSFDTRLLNLSFYKTDFDQSLINLSGDTADGEFGVALIDAGSQLDSNLINFVPQKTADMIYEFTFFINGTAQADENFETYYLGMNSNDITEFVRIGMIFGIFGLNTMFCVYTVGTQTSSIARGSWSIDQLDGTGYLESVIPHTQFVSHRYRVIASASQTVYWQIFDGRLNRWATFHHIRFTSSLAHPKVLQNHRIRMTNIAGDGATSSSVLIHNIQLYNRDMTDQIDISPLHPQFGQLIANKRFFSEFLKDSGAVNHNSNYSGGGVGTTDVFHTATAITVITSLNVHIADNDTCFSDLFGGLNSLSNGVLVWYQQTGTASKIFIVSSDLPIRHNSQWSLLGNSNFQVFENKANNTSFMVQINFDKNNGVPIHLLNGGLMGVTLDDNLSDLVEFNLKISGYELY